MYDVAFKVSNIEEFYNIVMSDTYVDDLSLSEFVSLSEFIKDNELYTVAQIKYILDTAITMATE